MKNRKQVNVKFRPFCLEHTLRRDHELPFQSMVHGRIGRRGAVAVAVVEEESPQERAPVPRRSLGASLVQERA